MQKVVKPKHFLGRIMNAGSKISKLFTVTSEECGRLILQ